MEQTCSLVTSLSSSSDENEDNNATATFLCGVWQSLVGQICACWEWSMTWTCRQMLKGEERIIT